MPKQCFEADKAIVAAEPLIGLPDSCLALSLKHVIPLQLPIMRKPMRGLVG
jgi:hypothetical protein